MKFAGGLTLALCAGCGSAGIAGGVQTAPGAEPHGKIVARYTVGRCEDVDGTRIPEPDSRIAVVRLPGGRVVLVERRPGYDSLIVDNGWTETDTRVFQLAFKRASSPPYLREYRLPMEGEGFGRLVFVKAVYDWGDSSKGFHATYVKHVLACDLAPA